MRGMSLCFVQAASRSGYSLFSFSLPLHVRSRFLIPFFVRGDQVFRRRQADMDRLQPADIERSRSQLADLERRFLERVAMTNRCKTGGEIGVRVCGSGSACGSAAVCDGNRTQRPVFAPVFATPPQPLCGIASKVVRFFFLFFVGRHFTTKG